jgi:RNA polymerase sigma factor (sigma-70 family)
MKGKSKLKTSLQKLVQLVKQKSSKKAAPQAESHPSSTCGEGRTLLWNDAQVRKPKLTIEQVLEGYRNSGNPALAARIYQEYWHLVLGGARRLLDAEDEAEDAASEVFLKVLDRLRLETPRNFAGWLYTVTRYHCFEIRRKRKMAPMLEPLDGLRQIADDSPDYALVDERESAIAIAVRRALATLPSHQRACVELFYFEDQSYREIADARGYGLNEVKSYIQNGKRRLMGLLATVRNQHVSDC